MPRIYLKLEEIFEKLTLCTGIFGIPVVVIKVAMTGAPSISIKVKQSRKMVMNLTMAIVVYNLFICCSFQLILIPVLI